MSISFTQFLRPDGRKRPVEIDMPDEIEAKANELIKAGYRFEIEELTTGLINMDCNQGDVVLSQQLCPNGPPVVDAVHSLVEESYERWQALQTSELRKPMDHEENYNDGKPTLIVWRASNMPKNMNFYPVPDPKAGAWLIHGLVTADLENDGIFSNAFGLMELEDDEWTEWYDDETGDDIMAFVDDISQQEEAAILEPRP